MTDKEYEFIVVGFEKHKSTDSITRFLDPFFSGLEFLDYTGKFPEDKIGAIEASLDKWKFILQYAKDNNKLLQDIGSDTCALCHLYEGCNDCPIASRYDSKECRGTPFYVYTDSTNNKNVEYGIKAAGAFVRILEEILEEESVEI